LPAPILDRWRDWEQFAGSARGLCPWAPPPDPPRPARTRRRPTGDSIISAFNEAHEVSAILEAHGYARRGKRFASPGTGHAPGVVLLESGKAFCHHAGDPLSGEHAHDAFDCFRLLAHGGDMRAAVKAAAAALGLERRSA
jgi:putative DNA primase/helicase